LDGVSDGNDTLWVGASVTRIIEGEGRGGGGSCFRFEGGTPTEFCLPDRESGKAPFLKFPFDWSFAACARWITEARSVPAG
jgi:hypothetical protein